MYHTPQEIIEKYFVRTYRYAVDGDGIAWTYRGDSGAGAPLPAEGVMGSIVSRDLRVAVTAAIISLAFAAAVFFALPGVAGVILGCLALPSAGLLLWPYLARNSRFIVLKYGLTGGAETFFRGLCAGLAQVAEAEQAWGLVPGHGGKKDRSEASVGMATPHFLLASIDIFYVRYAATVAYFFPDFLLLRRGLRYRAISYNSLDVAFREKPSREEGPFPGDARRLGHTWLHPAKNGGPDRRYRDNRRIPVALYGSIIVSINGHEEIRLLVSRHGAARAFAAALGVHAGHYAEQLYVGKKEKVKKERPKKEYSQSADRDHEARYWSERDKAGPGRRGREKKAGGGESGRPKPSRSGPWTVLGISPGAGKEEIHRAYRLLVKRYHPDTMGARSDEEVRKAEEKLKEINRAYDEIKRGGNTGT